MTVNATNDPKHHLGVAVGSAAFGALLWMAGYDVGRVLGAVPWFLLFLVMVIGPVVRIWPSITRRFEGNFPVNWRAELGIWFVLWSVAHLLHVFSRRNWDLAGYLTSMSPWAFGATVAVAIGVLMLFTSNRRAYDYLGARAWKWHQSHGTYVIFWLVAVHAYDRAYLRPGFPSDDPLHWAYLLTMVTVVVLHFAAFARVVSRHRRTGRPPREDT